MPAAYYRCTVSIPTDTAIPADTVNNVWSFRNVSTADHDLDALEITGRLDGFYTELATLFSSRLDLAGTRLTIVDMAEESPRLPFYDEAMAISGESSTNNDLPAEVAICLSFRGSLGSGLNARRRRGRIYLGPLQVQTGDRAVPDTAWPPAIVSAAETNIGTLDGDVEWCVYSRYTHCNVPVGTQLDPDVHEEDPLRLVLAFVPVVHWWCDNAWDTQRRRGPIATARSSADLLG